MEVVRISKYLSYLLRHGAEENGLKMSDDGYVAVNAIINLQKSPYRMNLDVIKRIVDSNDKKRFELIQASSGEWKIRASQGH